MTDSTLQQFAQLLAAEEEPAKRAALVKRAQMLAMNEASPEAFEPPVTALGDYLATPIPIPPSIAWPTIVVRGELTVTLGRAGKGKTTMNLNRVLKWSAGRPLFDNFKNKEGEIYLRPDKPVRSLIIENEGSAGMFHQKMGVLVNLCGDLLTDDDRKLIRENVYIWGDGGYSGLKLDDPNALSQVRAGVDKVRPDILFIEPFRGLWKGEENSSTDMAVVIDNLLGIATDYGCGVILSHHERKSGAGDDGELMSAGRGSTVLEGAAAVMENFQSVKGGDFREMTWSKARYLQPPPPLRLEYVRETGWYRHVEQSELETAVVEVLRDSGDEPMNKTAISEELGERPEKIARVLRTLAESERIKKLPSVYGDNGSTGFRYILPNENIDHGGLAI